MARCEVAVDICYQINSWFREISSVLNGVLNEIWALVPHLEVATIWLIVICIAKFAISNPKGVWIEAIPFLLHAFVSDLTHLGHLIK